MIAITVSKLKVFLNLSQFLYNRISIDREKCNCEEINDKICACDICVFCVVLEIVPINCYCKFQLFLT